jgi:cytochrome c-type biogenesis protein CcsB
MKKVFNLLFSTRFMAVIIAIFAISIATATFVENDFGSQTARALIYNSWWFELMLFIGIINLVGIIFMNKLYRRSKLTIFVFHLSFLFILLGATITHFFGFEGFIHIRQGEISNKMVSSNTYLCATAVFDKQTAYAEKPVYVSSLTNNYHKLTLNTAGNHVTVECLQIIPNAVKKIVDDPKGEPMLEFVVAGNSGRETVILADKQPKIIGNTLFSLNDTTNRSGVSILSRNNELQFRSGIPSTSVNMATQAQDTISTGIYHPLTMRTLYNFNGIKVVATDFNLHGRIDVANNTNAKPDDSPDALQIRVSTGEKSETMLYFANHNALNTPADIKLNNGLISVSFGAKTVQLPFSLQLKKFILEHYPGSESPSWFESRIVLRDGRKNLQQEHRIFMNNVLKYGGFRLFQSSYDVDEQGTILAANYDFWGTSVTYFGYLMLAIGIVLSILNKNSRFRKLSGELSRIRQWRTVTTVLTIFLLFQVSVKASNGEIPDTSIINKQHAAEFGKLLVQDPGGRTKPVNSLSSELLRKVSRKTSFMEQNSDQVMLGMMFYPELWQRIPMIKVSHPKIQEILKIRNGYASFLDVIDTASSHSYLLKSYVDEAYRKKPGNRNQFDSEIIRLDERINLCYMIYTGELLRILPDPNPAKKTWYAPSHAVNTFKGNDSLFISKIIPMYALAIKNASKTGDWTLPDKILSALQDFQHKFGKELIPSDFKIKTEIFYNKAMIFDRLMSIYGLAGFILLLFQFMSVFFPKLNLKPVIRITTFVIIICFVTHLAGLITRWYISGHAPWSNAYESLIFIAFATVLAGIIFSRKSSITISATALLAWLILFVAHLNWIDPEITNLVPVLKSYWLLIHVAMITASYGFMALGALLAGINLIMMVAQSKNNQQTTGGIIAELSIIIEMTLIIGLFMLTIGTFLGGVWANESWGRYWGWDPKETWALISVLTYAFIVHMRMVPGLKGNYTFNLMALVGFSSVIMTYFGVNYYLSGLHSYAKGDPLPIPTFVYYTLATIALLATLAWINQRSLKTTSINQTPTSKTDFN